MDLMDSTSSAESSKSKVMFCAILAGVTDLGMITGTKNWEKQIENKIKKSLICFVTNYPVLEVPYLFKSPVGGSSPKGWLV